jgi:hypothetical protein
MVPPHDKGMSTMVHAQDADSARRADPKCRPSGHHAKVCKARRPDQSTVVTVVVRRRRNRSSGAPHVVWVVGVWLGEGTFTTESENSMYELFVFMKYNTNLPTLPR